MTHTTTESPADRRTAPRVPLETEIRIFYPDLRRLADEICRDVSVGGMFIESAAPLAVGTRLRFELSLPARRPRVVHGEGEVVWRRPPGGDPARLPGYGVRFVDLDPRFRELIFRTVDRFIQGGGEPFDLDAEA